MTKALVRATFCGRGNTFQQDVECTTDLPADALGEVVARVLNLAWRAGEDPANCAVTLVFHMAPEASATKPIDELFTEEEDRKMAEYRKTKHERNGPTYGNPNPERKPDFEVAAAGLHKRTAAQKATGDKLVADNLRSAFPGKLAGYSDRALADAYEVFRNTGQPEDQFAAWLEGPAPGPGEHQEVIDALKDC